MTAGSNALRVMVLIGEKLFANLLDEAAGEQWKWLVQVLYKSCAS